MNVSQHWKPSEIETMHTMLAGGCSDVEIAEKVGRTPHAVRNMRYRQSNVVRREVNAWTLKELGELKKMVELGFSDSGIGAVLNRSASSIRAARYRWTDHRHLVRVDHTFYERIKPMRDKGKTWSYIADVEGTTINNAKSRFARSKSLYEALHNAK